MADIENEVSQDTQIDQTGLDNLSPADKKETEEILGEISKGGESDAKPADEKKGEEGEEIPPKKAPEAKAEEKTVDKENAADETKASPRREASVVPAWKLKVAEDQKGKTEKELNDLKAKQDQAIKDGAKPEEVAADTEKKLAEIAEKTGMEVDTLKELGKIFATAPAEQSPEIKEALAEIARNKADSAAAVEIAQFSADFDKDILPLIKKEYGDKEGNVPPETVTKIKESMASIAYTAEYAKVPYAEIYRGKEEFRGIIPPASTGAERSRGGTTRMAEDNGAAKTESVDWAKLESDPTFAIDDEALKKLSDVELDKYFSIVEKRK